MQQLQFRDGRLLEAIAQQSQRKAAILTPHDISQLASAYARLSYQHPALLQLLNTQAVAKAPDFAPWVLVHTAWALHVCGQQVGELLAVAVPLLRDRVQELKELDVSSLLWLMAGVCRRVLMGDVLVSVHMQQGGDLPCLSPNFVMCAAVLST